MTNGEKLQRYELPVSKIRTELTFSGVFDSSYQYSKGDVVFKDGMTQCFDGEKFIEIDGIEGVTTYIPESKPKKILPKNCVRCGAPVNSYHIKCEYCGCEY